MAGELGDAASAAVDLLRIVAYLEGKIIEHRPATKGKKPDRKWLFNTYAECLDAILTAYDEHLKRGQYPSTKGPLPHDDRGIV